MILLRVNGEKLDEFPDRWQSTWPVWWVPEVDANGLITVRVVCPVGRALQSPNKPCYLVEPK